MPRIGLAAGFFGVRRAASGIFENNSAVVADGDFFEPPWQAVEEWIPDDEPDLNWFNQRR